MTFTDNCIWCYHTMQQYDIGCPCNCHEDLKLLAKFHDMSVEEAIRIVKQKENEMDKDPILFAEAKFLNESGIADQVWKAARQKVADK